MFQSSKFMSIDEANDVWPVLSESYVAVARTISYSEVIADTLQ